MFKSLIKNYFRNKTTSIENISHKLNIKYVIKYKVKKKIIVQNLSHISFCKIQYTVNNVIFVIRLPKSLF